VCDTLDDVVAAAVLLGTLGAMAWSIRVGKSSWRPFICGTFSWAGTAVGKVFVSHDRCRHQKRYFERANDLPVDVRLWIGLAQLGPGISVDFGM
jgi:membrane protein YdbS with pleckstrin-like domain